jgi:hypothetical protein
MVFLEVVCNRLGNCTFFAFPLVFIFAALGSAPGYSFYCVEQYLSGKIFPPNWLKHALS